MLDKELTVATDAQLETATGGATAVLQVRPVDNSAFAVRPIAVANNPALRLDTVRLSSGAMFAFAARRC